MYFVIFHFCAIFLNTQNKHISHLSFSQTLYYKATTFWRLYKFFYNVYNCLRFSYLRLRFITVFCFYLHRKMNARPKWSKVEETISRATSTVEQRASLFIWNVIKWKIATSRKSIYKVCMHFRIFIIFTTSFSLFHKIIYIYFVPDNNR